MSDLPPAYQSLKDIYEQLPDKTKNQIKALTSISPDATVKSKLVRAVHQRVSDETFQDQLLEEVDALSSSVFQLAKAFEVIKAKLGTVGTLQYKTYRATWEEYQNVGRAHVHRTLTA